MKQEITFGIANQKKLSVNRKELSQWTCQASLSFTMTWPNASVKTSVISNPPSGERQRGSQKIWLAQTHLSFILRNPYSSRAALWTVIKGRHCLRLRVAKVKPRKKKKRKKGKSCWNFKYGFYLSLKPQIIMWPVEFKWIDDFLMEVLTEMMWHLLHVDSWQRDPFL